MAHIIERRNSEGQDGEEFVRNLPTLIKEGTVISKENHNDRKYILSKDKEIALKLEFNGEKRNWVVSAYTKKELQGSNSFKDRYTMHAHDSNLNVANGYVSIATPITNIITNVKNNFNPTAKNQIQQNAASDDVNLSEFIEILKAINDGTGKWITVHPNGKENKGRHLLIKDGENLD